MKDEKNGIDKAEVKRLATVKKEAKAKAKAQDKARKAEEIKPAIVYAPIAAPSSY